MSPEIGGDSLATPYPRGNASLLRSQERLSSEPRGRGMPPPDRISLHAHGLELIAVPPSDTRPGLALQRPGLDVLMHLNSLSLGGWNPPSLYVPLLLLALVGAQEAPEVPDEDQIETAPREREDPPADADSGIELAHLIEFLDRDRDGRIEAYEGAEAMLFLVAEADASDDGALSTPELRNFLEESRDEEAAEREEAFREFDADGDGLLTPEEVPDELQGVLGIADQNGDGLLALGELLTTDALDDPRIMFEQELLGFLASVDGDGDGAFALTDLPLLDRIPFAPQFKELDTNADDLVDEAELLAMLEEELRGASFDVQGRDAVMTGVIGPSTPGRVLELVLEHPEVERIVMRNVPGSMDDHSNLRAARLVRRCGLATHVPAGGEVASGGTDFFQAGTTRTMGEGARFGIHSWSGMGEEGAQVPKDDPEHVKYVEYCREMGIPESFYWYTLEAAPADDIHWMTDEELARFDMLTHAVETSREPGENDLLGGCILTEPRGEVPAQVQHVSAVSGTDDYGPFPKLLNACGIVLAAEAEVPDRFLERVGRTVAEIFRADEGVDVELQREVLAHLHAYKALLPVPCTEESFERILEENPEAFERIQRENSACDIIMAEVPEGQVMEVVEHILHAVTDVGLHYQFPEEWGISRESELWRTMLLASERGHFAIESYDDLKRHDEPEVYERILLQEFAYWFISTAWNLQEPYGPDEREWTIRTREELRKLYPDFFATFERTVERVMRAPTTKTLAEFGPTRAEERGR